jgi:hypothetical protein
MPSVLPAHDTKRRCDLQQKRDGHALSVNVALGFGKL